jgi:hypothetical protein
VKEAIVKAVIILKDKLVVTEKINQSSFNQAASLIN